MSTIVQLRDRLLNAFMNPIKAVRRPIDYTLKRGDICVWEGWSLGLVEVVDVNWALSSVAVNLKPLSNSNKSVVVIPAYALTKKKE